MTRRALLRALLAGAIAAACTTSDGPTDPVWGKQSCAHCAMVVSDRRFAAQLLTAAGDRHFFDDPGCLVSFGEDRGLGSARAWVYDDGVRRWVDARAERYQDGAATPMDFGFEAKGDGGLGWADVRARVLAKARGPR